jgi:hypothetical protein
VRNGTAKHIAIIQGHSDVVMRHYGHALADEYAWCCAISAAGTA